MSDLLKALESRVSPADWERMAKYANVSASVLKIKLLDALQNQGEVELTTAMPFPRLSDVTPVNDCTSQSFEISLFKIVGLAGTLTLCGDQSTKNWSAELKACLLVADSKVWCTSYRFDPHNISVCFEPNVGVAKAKLCFKLEIANDKICLNINGNACLWAFGWQCGNFDTTVFCLPL